MKHLIVHKTEACCQPFMDALEVEPTLIHTLGALMLHLHIFSFFYKNTSCDIALKTVTQNSTICI
jgi:hypothetical protein